MGCPFNLVVGGVLFEMTRAARDYLVKHSHIMQFGEPDEYIFIAGATLTVTDVTVVLNASTFDGEAGQ